MAKVYEETTSSKNNNADKNQQQERDSKQKIQNQQEQCRQLQRELADAISRLASLDDIRILLACGARVDGPVTQGLHPIHYAAYQNFVSAARLLILRGCDINALDDNGYAPIHFGAERGYYDLLELLIANGAKVCFTDLKNKQQATATTSCSQFLNNNSPVADEPLSLALRRGHMDCAELLLRNGADPNARYFMGSEINLISVVKVSSIKLLLEYGANPDSRDRSGLTPLMKAARHPLGYATVKLLIDYGADVNDIASERHDYRTVLHHSILSGNADLIKLILTSGARYPKLDFDKPSPLDIAIISGRHDIVRLLIEFDADVNAGPETTIGQPLHTALTQRIDNKREIVKLLLENGSDPNSRTTSNRNTGPPLHDYLYSIRQSGANLQNSPSPLPCPPSLASGGADLEMVRLMIMYGARIILKTPTQNPLGLVRTLEKIQEELSLDLLHLLIDAAEEIDWFMMSKVIYGCLRHTNRSRTNELFDPSVSADMTPERLSALLADKSAHHHGLSESLVKLFNGGKNSSAVLTLKQISRINIRQHLIEDNGYRGHTLINKISCLSVPFILKKYLLYQNV